MHLYWKMPSKVSQHQNISQHVQSLLSRHFKAYHPLNCGPLPNHSPTPQQSDSLHKPLHPNHPIHFIYVRTHIRVRASQTAGVNRSKIKHGHGGAPKPCNRKMFLYPLSPCASYILHTHTYTRACIANRRDQQVEM